MTLDRFCYGYFLAMLPILCLPRAWLASGLMLAFFGLLIAVWQRAWRWGVLGLALAISYGRVIVIAEQANQVKVSRVTETIQIIQLVQQQGYQTAIARRENGERIRLNWQAEAPLALHRHYVAELRIRPLSSRFNFSNGERQKNDFAQHLYQTATVKRAKLVAGTALPWRTQWLVRVKQQTDGLASQGLLLALAFGERAWLSKADWQRFQQTSTAHLIAISGLHIALAFAVGALIGKAGQAVGLLGLAYGADRRSPAFVRGWQAVCFSPFFAKAVGLLFAVGYSFLAGFAVPTVRALLAIGLYLACQWGRRHYTPWQYGWRCVTLLLLFDPLALLSSSFWLSVLAVASLMTWYQHFPLSQWHWLPARQRWPKIGRGLLALVHLQLGIWLIFSPVQLAFFNGVSPVAILTNLLIVPLYSLLLVPLILFTLLTDNLFHSWQLADWLAQGSLSLLSPFAPQWQPLSLAQQGLLLGGNLLLLAGLYLLQHGLQKGRRMIPLALLGGVCCWVVPQRVWQAPVQWITFDVGQGLAMALVYPEAGKRKAIVYDTGASWGDLSMAKLELLPYFQRQGIDITAIFVSHDDNDHAGGVRDLLAAYPHARLILSGKNRYSQGQAEPCIAGQAWQFGDIRLVSLFPEQISERAGNAHSCVLRVTVGAYRLLWTGDSGIAQEQQFSRQVGKIHFLQVGHHGSNSSTSETLLAHIQPEVAVISAGRWNPWQLPRLQVEKRLARYQVQTFNTAQVGMVRVDFYPNRGYQIHTARHPWTAWYQALLGG